MTGFYIEPVVLGHPRFKAAGGAASWLWAAGAVWSADNDQGGFVSTLAVRAYGTVGQAKRLVEVELWEQVDGGYRFLRWRNGHPTPDTEAEERLADRRRSDARRKALQRNPTLREAIRERDADRCRYCGKPVVWTDTRGPRGGTFDHVDPRGGNVLSNLVVACRFDNGSKGQRTPEQAQMILLPPPPSADVRRTVRDVRTESASDSPPLDTASLSEVPPLYPPQGNSQPEAAREKAPAPPRKTPYPKDFAATDAHRSYAYEHHLNLADQLEAFRDHALMTGRTGIDWNAGFRNWLKIAAERKAANPTPRKGSNDWMNP